MKKRSSFLHHRGFSAMSIIVFVLLVSVGCNKNLFLHDYSYPPYTSIPKDTSVILWKNPKASDADFEKWKLNHNLSPTQKIDFCTFCSDDKLELYTGVPITAFMSGSGGTPCPTCKPNGGGDDTVYYSYNFPIDVDTSFFQGQEVDTSSYSEDKKIILGTLPHPTSLPTLPAQTATGPIVNIGVMDTGVDPSITTNNTFPLPGACDHPGFPAGSTARGWNFAGDNDHTGDDYPSMHGTSVAKLIL